VIGGAAAILAMPAQLFASVPPAKKLISSDEWQAFKAVETRVEAKLVAATKLYLQTAPIRDTAPLNPLETAQNLLDRGDGETAMSVFQKASVSNPEMQRQAQQMIAKAEISFAVARPIRCSARLSARFAGGNDSQARTILGEYEHAPLAELGRADAIRRAIAAAPIIAPTPLTKQCSRPMCRRSITPRLLRCSNRCSAIALARLRRKFK